jgi:glycosyltransferase involved in cell wall biosynthesis
LEILIQDDGSSDDTLEICRRHADEDSRIRVEQTPRNRGAWGNIALAVERARGQYVCWAAQDDSWQPQYISTLVRRLSEVPGAIAAQSAVARFDEETHELIEIHSLGGPSAPESLGTLLRARATLIKARSGEKRPSYSYFLGGLVSTEAFREALRAFIDPTTILDERMVVCHWALAGPLVTVDEPLIWRAVHTKPAVVRWPTDPTLRRRAGARFVILRCGGQFVRSIWCSALLPLSAKLLAVVVITDYMQRQLLHSFTIRAVPVLRSLLPSRVYGTLRHWYRLAGALHQRGTSSKS